MLPTHLSFSAVGWVGQASWSLKFSSYRHHKSTFTSGIIVLCLLRCHRDTGTRLLDFFQFHPVLCRHAACVSPTRAHRCLGDFDTELGFFVRYYSLWRVFGPLKKSKSKQIVLFPKEKVADLKSRLIVSPTTKWKSKAGAPRATRFSSLHVKCFLVTIIKPRQNIGKSVQYTAKVHKTPPPPEYSLFVGRVTDFACQ